MADTDKRVQLLETFTEQGIQNTHFFNGRLLTAADLLTEQKASLSRRRQVGRALGVGVVEGLEVSLAHNGADGEPPRLAVRAGLAFNRLGEAVELSVNVEVALKERIEARPTQGGLFDVCLPPQNNSPFPGKGAYILAARPAASFNGRAPRRGLGSAAKVEDCDRDLAVEGLEFVLAELDLNSLPLSQSTRSGLADLMARADAPAMYRLRNWLAHLCLGTEECVESIRNLLPAPPGTPPFDNYGAADALRYNGQLAECDVPLAMLYWLRSGVQFVDCWAVRRRVTRLAGSSWDGLAGERLRAEGEAAFFQFQDQITEMTRPTVSRAQLINLAVNDYFRYLPSVGVIPFTTGLGTRGFDYLRFFSGLTVREPVFTEGRKVPALIQLSFAYRPVDLESGEMLWLYLVRENRQPLQGSPTPNPQPYLIYAHGHLPFQGEAMFDLSYWNFSNYG